MPCPLQAHLSLLACPLQEHIFHSWLVLFKSTSFIPDLSSSRAHLSFLACPLQEHIFHPWLVLKFQTDTLILSLTHLLPSSRKTLRLQVPEDLYLAQFEEHDTFSLFEALMDAVGPW